MKKLIWLAVLVLSLSSWNLAFGQTADGATPAEESVCDLMGYTGAAWGLCNAYCEAMDCDSKAVNSSDASCDRVRDNFISKTGKKLVCKAYGKPCLNECKVDYKERVFLCQNDYEKALKKCNDDKVCTEKALLVYDGCVNEADYYYAVCTTKCSSKDCKFECNELKDLADQKCFDDFCKDGICVEEYDVCITNNYREYKKCLSECDFVIKLP